MFNKDRIRILYITYLGILEPIPKSQVLPYLFELSKFVKIHLLSFEKKGLIKKEFNELRQIKDRLQEKNITWHRLHYHKYPLILSSFFDIFLGALVSLLVIIRYKISILHARSNIPIAIGYILRLILPIKILYDRRGIMGEEHVEYSGWKREGYLYRLAIWFEKRAIEISNAIVVLTGKINTQLKKYVKNSKGILIETIPCCIDLQLFNYDTNQNLKEKMGLSKKFILIYSGSLGTYNLLNEMFDFFKEALELIPHAHFLILTQNLDTAINLMMKRKDIDKDKVTITYVPYEKLPSFLSIGDAGLVFRKLSPTAIAASPVKFGEYLACGLPVISTPRIGDLEEIISSRKVGVILSRHNRSEYGLGINNLLSLLTEKESIRKRCRQTAEDIFPLEHGRDVYLNIYYRLINNK